jgi:hypothetical protein
MTDKERQDYAALKEAELREQEARMAKVEARARADQANDRLQEVSGVRRLQASVKEGLQRLKSAASDSWEADRKVFQDLWSALTSGVEKVTGKAAEVDETLAEQIDDELDALAAQADEIDARIAQRGIQMKMDIQEQVAAVRRQGDAAREEWRRVKREHDESRREVTSRFKESLERLKKSLSEARQRVDEAGGEPAQPHT